MTRFAAEDAALRQLETQKRPLVLVVILVQGCKLEIKTKYALGIRNALQHLSRISTNLAVPDHTSFTRVHHQLDFSALKDLK